MLTRAHLWFLFSLDTHGLLEMLSTVTWASLRTVCVSEQTRGRLRLHREQISALTHACGASVCANKATDISHCRLHTHTHTHTLTHILISTCRACGKLNISKWERGKVNPCVCVFTYIHFSDKTVPIKDLNLTRQTQYCCDIYYIPLSNINLQIIYVHKPKILQILNT